MGNGSADALPTGFASLDTALGIGGLPRGRIVEIFGAASSGKTALALQAIAHVQRNGGAAAWIDAERAFDAAFASQLGADLPHLAVTVPGSAEEAMDMARRFTASGAVDLVVIDSAAALVPEVEIEAGVGEAGRSVQSRVLASELRSLSEAARRTGAIILFLNQTRSRLGSTGEIESSSGGPPIKLHASVRIALSAAGRRVRFRVLKNKLAAAFTAGELEWRTGSGFVEGH